MKCDAAVLAAYLSVIPAVEFTDSDGDTPVFLRARHRSSHTVPMIEAGPVYTWACGECELNITTKPTPIVLINLHRTYPILLKYKIYRHNI